MLEVGPLQQPGEIAVQLVEPVLLLLGRQRHQRPGVGVRVERGIGRLQFLQAPVILEVESGADQLAELSEQLAVRFT
jgi:hypothetical protein